MMICASDAAWFDIRDSLIASRQIIRWAARSLS